MASRTPTINSGAEVRRRMNFTDDQPDGLSRSPRLPASHQVRPEESDDESHDGESKIAVDVLSMVKEVSVNYLIDGDDNYHDQQPDAPMGNKMLPHARQDPFRQSFRQAC